VPFPRPPSIARRSPPAGRTRTPRPAAATPEPGNAALARLFGRSRRAGGHRRPRRAYVLASVVRDAGAATRGEEVGAVRSPSARSGARSVGGGRLFAARRRFRASVRCDGARWVSRGRLITARRRFGARRAANAWALRAPSPRLSPAPGNAAQTRLFGRSQRAGGVANLNGLSGAASATRRAGAATRGRRWACARALWARSGRERLPTGAFSPLPDDFAPKRAPATRLSDPRAPFHRRATIPRPSEPRRLDSQTHGRLFTARR
jgi:hypothetical protein